jgi:hypothetical protein
MFREPWFIREQWLKVVLSKVVWSKVVWFKAPSLPVTRLHTRPSASPCGPNLAKVSPCGLKAGPFSLVSPPLVRWCLPVPI